MSRRCKFVAVLGALHLESREGRIWAPGKWNSANTRKLTNVCEWRYLNTELYVQNKILASNTRVKLAIVEKVAKRLHIDKRSWWIFPIELDRCFVVLLFWQNTYSVDWFVFEKRDVYIIKVELWRSGKLWFYNDKKIFQNETYL